MDNTELNTVRIFAQQSVLTALVMTHPNPLLFADTLEQIVTHGQLDWIQSGVDHDAQQAALSLFSELIDIARMEAEHRAQPPGSSGTVA